MKNRIRVEITPEIHEKLRREYERIGLGGSALMRGKRGDYPKSLKNQMIDRWRAGPLASAKADHLRWVLDAYDAWRPPEPDPAPTKITITHDLHKQLLSDVERTRLGAVAILRHAPKPLPEGLNHQKVQRWISGNTKTARKAHWDLVMRLYAEVDDPTN